MRSSLGARLTRLMSSCAVTVLVVSVLALTAPAAQAAVGDEQPLVSSPAEPPADSEQLAEPEQAAEPEQPAEPQTPAEPETPVETEPEPPADPVVNAAAPAISGAASVGAVLTATPGSWLGDPALSYQWLANGAAVPGATAPTLTLVPAHKNTTITVTVTGAKEGYDPVSATSAPTARVGPGALKVVTPTISGTIASGSTLTAKPGAWTQGTAFAYQWYAGGKAIGKATKATYKLAAAHVGKRITVRITGAKADYVTANRMSAASPKVAKAATPVISGTKRAGQTLTAKPGSWTKGTKFSYQWMADGKAISKATKSKLKLTKALAGKAITVRVTGKKAGYATVAKTAAPIGRWPGRWIEVDLSSQRMYLHDGGKVISTHLVSTGKKGHSTHTGTFRIRAKVRIQNMGCVRGYDYCTKNVPWVLYFNGDQALHGAYWHKNFGRVMSHGCVNLPVSVAKRVYSWSKVGTIVWVHQ